MSKVSQELDIGTARSADGATCFTLSAAGVEARSTSSYASQANALEAAARLTDGSLEAEVVERDGGFAVRVHGASLEAVTDPFPTREQAETAVRTLTS